jgi:hypothetical protein
LRPHARIEPTGREHVASEKVLQAHAGRHVGFGVLQLLLVARFHLFGFDAHFLLACLLFDDALHDYLFQRAGTEPVVGGAHQLTYPNRFAVDRCHDLIGVGQRGQLRWREFSRCGLLGWWLFRCWLLCCWFLRLFGLSWFLRQFWLSRFLLGCLLTIFGCCGFRLGRFLLLDVNRAQALLLSVSPILQEPILQDSFMQLPFHLKKAPLLKHYLLQLASQLPLELNQALPLSH